MILTLLKIAILVVCIIDLTDINQTFKKVIAYLLKTTPERVKVNLCSLCICWWCSLAYIILTNQFTINNLMWCGIICVFTSPIKEIIKLIQDLIYNIINRIYEIIE